MTLTNQNIEQLLLQCKLGNQNAQMEVYNRYYKAMYNTSFRIVKDRFEAEDIMQDSFLTAFTKLTTLNELKTFGAWLKRIVINNSIHHYNKNNKFNEVNLDSVLYKVEESSGVTEAEKDSLSNLKANEVLKHIKLLKDNYRMGLTLYLIEGYDYEEISEIMELSYANCRTLISRAKERLRQNMLPLVS